MDRAGGSSLPQHFPVLQLSSSLLSPTAGCSLHPCHSSHHHLPPCPSFLFSCVSSPNSQPAIYLSSDQNSAKERGEVVTIVLRPTSQLLPVRLRRGLWPPATLSPSLPLLSNTLSMASCRSCLLNIYRKASGRDEGSGWWPPQRAGCHLLL